MIATSFLGLLIVVGIFTLCIVATVRMKSAWPLMVLSAFIVVAFGLLTISRVRQEATVKQVYAMQPRISEERDGASLVSLPAASSTAWDTVDTNQFRTLLFPSVESAARDLAKQIPSVIAEMKVESDPPKSLMVRTSFAERVSENVRSPFKKQILNFAPDATFQTSKIAEEASAAEIEIDENLTSYSVQIQLSQQPKTSATAPWDANETSKSGSLTCVVTTQHGTQLLKVDYIEKPWVESLARFSNQRPNEEFVVGVSPSLCESPRSAKQSAFDNIKHIQLRTVFDGREVQVPIDESVIVDRFLQELQRPYGKVWREAVLVDLRGRRAETLKANAVAQISSLNHRQRSQASENWLNLLILIGVFAAVAVVGFILNLVTEGYLRGKIAVTITALAIAFAVLFFIRVPW